MWITVCSKTGIPNAEKSIILVDISFIKNQCQETIACENWCEYGVKTTYSYFWSKFEDARSQNEDYIKMKYIEVIS